MPQEERTKSNLSFNTVEVQMKETKPLIPPATSRNTKL